MSRSIFHMKPSPPRFSVQTNKAERRSSGSVALWLVAAFVSAGPLQAADVTTHKVARGALKTSIQWDAVFEAREMHPIRLAPRAWQDMTVVDALEQGATVKKGQPLVRLDLEKLREQIADIERDQPAARVAMEVAEAELRHLAESTPLRLEAARRSQRVASEEYDYFTSTLRDQREQTSRFSVKSAEERLESAKEELRQLEKMYKADDLTEDTEEIILKRQRFAVEASEFYLNNARQNMERELKVNLPRDHESLKAKKRDEDLSLALLETTLPRALEKKRQEVEKLKRDQEKAARRHEDLKHDLAMLEVKSPAGGIVYHGACDQGRWTTAAMVSRKLAPGGKLLPNEVIMTVVEPAKLQLRASVAEGDLSRIKPGMKGEAVPVSAPHLKLAAVIEEISLVPLAAGGYGATLSFKMEKGARLVPGMNCKVTFKDVPKAEALLVPKEAVVTENKQTHVLVKSGGREEKRTVKTGESDDTMIEILEGLKAGDIVVVKKAD